MPLSSRRTGELLILLCTFLWSFFPIVTIFSYQDLPTFFAAGTATLLSALFFAILLTTRRKWHQLLHAAVWGDILLISLFIGISYILVFFALTLTTAGNVSIMSVMEIFFTFFIMGILLRHERLEFLQVLGGSCMVIGAALILSPHASGWNGGNFLVVLATFIAPFGNYFAQRIRRTVSTEGIMFVRSVLIGIVLVGISFFFESLPSYQAFRHGAIPLLINAIFLLGLSKILWIEAIHRIPISTAVSLESVSPLVTLVFAYFLLKEPILFTQLVGFIPMFVGVMLLTRRSGVESSSMGINGKQ